MRSIIFLLAAFGLSACEIEPPERLSREACVATFQEFDRQIHNLLVSPYKSNAQPNNVVRLDRLTTKLNQGGCTIGRPQIQNILYSNTDRIEFRATNAGNPIAPQYVHFAAVLDFEAMFELNRYLRGLGYEVRSISATGIGRRVYLKNVRTDEAIAVALALAEDMGLTSAYAGPLRGISY